MISSPQHTETLSHLSEYTAEVALVFGRHGLGTQSISDLETGTRKLSEPGLLADDLSATVRSVVYREQEQVTEEDLTQLLLVSLAGEVFESEAADLSSARSRISSFLAVALRSFSRDSPEAPYKSRLSTRRSRQAASVPLPEIVPSPVPLLAESQPEASEQALTSSSGEAPAEASVVETDSLAVASVSHAGKTPFLDSTEFLDDPHMADNQDAVAREVARMLAADQALRGDRPLEPSQARPHRIIEEVRLAGEDEAPRISRPEAALAQPVRQPVVHTAANPSVLPADVSATIPSADEEGVYPEYRSFSFLRSEHRTLWIVGLCCLLVGLLAGLLARGQHGAGDRPAILAAPLPRTTGQTKPSPYTLPERMGSTSAGSAAERFPIRRESGPSNPADGQLAASADESSVDASGAAPVRVEARNTAQAPTARYTSQVPDEGASAGREGSGTAAEDAAAFPAGNVFLSAQGVMAANLVAAPAPAYPSAASAAGVQGRVVVQALVGRDGHVLDAHVTSGDRRLREAALEAVTRWRFRPFLQDGRAAEIETEAVLDFRLE